MSKDALPGYPAIELFDDSPRGITRPLSLAEGRAYAAIWPIVRQSDDRRPMTDDQLKSSVRRLPSAVRRQLLLVRDDGVLFGTGVGPLEATGQRVNLNEAPPAEKLWTVAGVRRYLAGERPRPAQVFAQLTEVVDHFLDFEQSLAPQRAMSELIGCYILATWFLDAFNVIGFLWPSGDRGSGKTKLLTLVAELGYLGQVILAGGSYATLRDLADYGATLAFDDAEALGDPRRGDANKRNLLLAGNRRGSRVTLKEMAYGQWTLKYVNTYCARLFSATRLPDPILASRTIVIPLVRTPSRERANAEVLDEASWPVAKARLLDDLWALALANLPSLPEYERAVADTGPLTGRGQERWRAILAVAWWLDASGVPGLRERIEAIAHAHQAEQALLETPDLTVLVITVLLDHFAEVIESQRAFLTDPLGAVIPVSASFVVDLIQRSPESADYEPRALTPTRIGMILQAMRLKQYRSNTRRRWEIPLALILRLAAAYALPIPDALGAPAPAASDSGATT